MYRPIFDMVNPTRNSKPTTGNSTIPTTGNWTTNGGFEEFTLDPSYPYYVHPSENPSSQLVPVVFNGSGYAIWRNSMITSLSTKNKLGMVNGKFPRHDSNNP